MTALDQHDALMLSDQGICMKPDETRRRRLSHGPVIHIIAMMWDYPNGDRTLSDNAHSYGEKVSLPDTIFHFRERLADGHYNSEHVSRTFVFHSAPSRTSQSVRASGVTTPWLTIVCGCQTNSVQ
jgi:hypothetical protein